MRSWRRRVLFVAFALALPLLANALRAALLIWLAARGLLDPQAVVLHFTYGLGFTGILLSLLMLLAWLMRERSLPQERLTFMAHRPVRRWPLFTAMLAVSVLAFLPFLVRVSSPAVAAGSVRLPDPTVAGSWSKAPPSPELRASADLVGASGHSATAWSGEGSRIELLLLYYRQEWQGVEAVGSLPRSLLESRWTEIGQRRSRLRLDSSEIDVPGRVQERAGEHRIVWTMYWVNGRVIANPLAAKVAQIAGRLLARRSGAARVELTLIGETAINEPEAVANHFLADLQPMGRLLENADLQVTN
jgi:EpsI family protein